MLARVAMPAVRQKRSKLAPTSCQASSTIATGMTAAIVVNSFMALLSFVDSAPRAYRLKVGNACPPISTSTGTSPERPRRPRNQHRGEGIQVHRRVPTAGPSAHLRQNGRGGHDPLSLLWDAVSLRSSIGTARCRPAG